MNKTGHAVELAGFVHTGTVPECWQEQDGAGAFPGYRLLLQPSALRLFLHLKTQSQTHLGKGGNSSVTRASLQSQTAAQGMGHFSKGWKLDC